jgi:RNA-binding protein PNO1
MSIKGGTTQMRKIGVPANRFTPLKKEWRKIYEPLVKHLNLQIRMNTKTNNVELKVLYLNIMIF